MVDGRHLMAGLFRETVGMTMQVFPENPNSQAEISLFIS